MPYKRTKIEKEKKRELERLVLRTISPPIVTGKQRAAKRRNRRKNGYGRFGGADDLQQLPLMDVFGIDLLIVDDGAQARTGKSDLGLRVFTLEQISMQTCCQSVTTQIS